MSLTSCDDTVDFRNGQESEKMVVETVISPDTPINFTKLTTSLVVNAQVQNIEFPQNADIVIRDLETNEEFEFIFDDNKCYSLTNATIDEGKTYEINASISNSDVLDVFATTKVPFSTDIDSIEQVQIDTIYNQDDNSKYGLRFEYSIIIDEPVAYPAFYRLIPMLKGFGLDAAGKLIMRSEDIYYFDNFDLIQGGNASHDLEHRNGLLINQSKLDDNRITVSFETTNSLRLGQDRVPKVFFALQTVEEDFYHYFLSSSRLIKASEAGSSQPIASYSNVTNGHGVFTSFSETLDSIGIN